MATLRIKRGTSNATPTSLQSGEIAYSYASNTLFIGSSSNNGSVLAIGGNALFANISSNGVSGAYLPLSGGTLSGPLVLNGDPIVANTNPLTAATREYVDVGQFGNLAFGYNTSTGYLSTVTYPDGSNAVFTYNTTGILISVVSHRPGYNTVTKTLSYTAGILSSIQTTSP